MKLTGENLTIGFLKIWTAMARSELYPPHGCSALVTVTMTSTALSYSRKSETDSSGWSPKPGFAVPRRSPGDRKRRNRGLPACSILNHADRARTRPSSFQPAKPPDSSVVRLGWKRDAEGTRIQRGGGGRASLGATTSIGIA